MNTLIRFAVTFAVFFGIDLIWLGLIAKDLYAKYLGAFLSPDVNWLAAILFYLLFIVGVLVFILDPALKDGDIKMLIIRAMLFGLITYATYDLTNLATMKGWPIEITVIDLIWGTSLSTLVSVVSYFILKALGQ